MLCLIKNNSVAFAVEKVLRESCSRVRVIAKPKSHLLVSIRRLWLQFVSRTLQAPTTFSWFAHAPSVLSSSTPGLTQLPYVLYTIPPGFPFAPCDPTRALKRTRGIEFESQSHPEPELEPELEPEPGFEQRVEGRG